MDHCSSSNKVEEKWQCSTCTYLNFQNSQKCVMCTQPKNKPFLLIEEAAETHRTPDPVPGHSLTIENSCSVETDEEQQQNPTHWTCPSCTYTNYLKSMRCVQCYTQRPQKYSEYHKHETTGSESVTLIESKSGGWNCPLCTYKNWPKSINCTICHAERPRSDPPKAIPILCEPSATISQQQQHSSVPSPSNVSRPLSARKEQTSAMDIYLRRYASNDPVEKLFFKGINAIVARDNFQMTNAVVEYLISEGNLQRSLTCFEVRMMDSMRVFHEPFEKGDTLMKLAKRTDQSDLVKLIRRATVAHDDKLSCTVNSSFRSRLYAKITKLFSSSRNHAQYLRQPFDFNIFNLRMDPNNFNVSVMATLFKPAPGLPPTFAAIDCIDCLSGDLHSVVDRPLSFLMKNRGGASSLCDSLFQANFGVCDRFGILRSALKSNINRSLFIFKERWLEQHFRMSKDVGITLSQQECDADWEEILNAIEDEEEFLEPIHIWVLSHVFLRPIIVFPYEELDMEELNKPESGKQRKQYSHFFEGIYLPVLLDPLPVSTTSPLLLSFRNGLFNAILLDDQPTDLLDIQRFVKFRKSNRLGDNPFRFLTQDEIANSELISKFIELGPSTSAEVSIRIDKTLPFFFDSLLFYSHWINSLYERENCLNERLSGIKLEPTLAGENKNKNDATTDRYQSSSSLNFNLMNILSGNAANILRNAYSATHLCLSRNGSPGGVIPATSSTSKIQLNEGLLPPDSDDEEEDGEDEEGDDDSDEESLCEAP